MIWRDCLSGKLATPGGTEGALSQAKMENWTRGLGTELPAFFKFDYQKGAGAKTVANLLDFNALKAHTSRGGQVTWRRGELHFLGKTPDAEEVAIS